MTGINFILVPSVFAMCAAKLANSWQPFFEPHVTKSALLKKLEATATTPAYVDVALQNSGGEAFVDAVGFRNKTETELFIQKTYYTRSDANADKIGFANLKMFEQDGKLSGFNVVNVIGIVQNVIKLEIVEGQQLTKILRDFAKHPEGLKLKERYMRYVKEIKIDFEAMGYLVVEQESPIDGLVDLAVYANGEASFANLVFSISTDNVMVEAATGQMTILDP